MRSDAKQCEARQSIAKGKAMKSNAKQCKTMPSNAKPCEATHSNAKQCKAMRSYAKHSKCKAVCRQGEARQGKARQGRAMQCWAMQGVRGSEPLGSVRGTEPLGSVTLGKQREGRLRRAGPQGTRPWNTGTSGHRSLCTEQVKTPKAKPNWGTTSSGL